MTHVPMIHGAVPDKALKEPWSAKKRRVVWGSVVGAALLTGAGTSLTLFLNKQAENDLTSKRAEPIMRMVPGMPSAIAFEAAAIARKNGISDSTIKEIAALCDTLEYAKRFGLTVADVLRTGVISKKSITFGFGPDGKPWEFSPPNASDGAKKATAAFNVLHIASNKAREEVKGETYVAPPPDTTKQAPQKPAKPQKGKKR